MEAIRVKLSTKCNGSELYCSTENSFAVIAGRLARIDRTRQRQAEKDRDRYREGQRERKGESMSGGNIRSRLSVPQKPSSLCLSFPLSFSSIPYSHLFTKPLVRSSNLNSLVDTSGTESLKPTIHRIAMTTGKKYRAYLVTTCFVLQRSQLKNQCGVERK